MSLSDSPLFGISRSPLQVILVGFLLAVTINALSTYYLIQQPEYGFSLSIDGEKILLQMDEQGKADSPPYNLLAIEGVGRTFELERDDFLPEPDVLPTYEQYNRFFHRQSMLNEFLDGTPLVLLTGEGHTLTVQAGSVHWSDIPLMYWVQLMVADICFLMGLAVWSFRKKDVAAIYYCLIGLCLAITVWPAAIYSSRELAIDGQVFQVLSAINRLGSWLAIAMINGFIWRFPQPFADLHYDRLILVLMPVHWLVDIMQWYPNMDVSTRYIPLSVVLGIFILIAVHWRHSRYDVVYRQWVKWILLTGAIGCGPATAFVAAPLFGQVDALSQSAAFSAFLIVYAGLAVGVAHYRFFDLDRWWFEVWLWLAIGVLVVIIDIGFISILDFSSTKSLWLSLTLSGWLYFPLRQWLASHLLNLRQERLETHLPMIVRSIARAQSGKEMTDECIDCLVNIYTPMNHRLRPIVSPLNSDEIEITDDGLTLIAPLYDESQAIELNCPGRGKRLFKPQDRTVVKALLQLFTQAREVAQAREQAVRQERQRIKEDMHDTIGGHLLSIMHQKSDPISATIARTAWSELRDILTALEVQGATLGQILEVWHSDITQQAGSTQTQLEWQVEDAVRESGITLDGTQRFNAGQILRELVTNALRHARPKLLQIIFSCNGGSLTLSVRNDGVQQHHADWIAGKGLHHIHKRAQRLSAQLHWESTTGSVCCRLTLPQTCAQTAETAEGDENDP